MYQRIYLLFILVFSIHHVEAKELSLPKFTLPQLEDTQSNVSENDILGRVVVLNVWESLCIPCISEHPLLLRLAQSGISIYGINLQDDPVKARRFLETRGNPFQANIMDKTGVLSKQLGVIGTPVTFILNKQGRVTYKKEGPLNESDLQEISVHLSNLKNF